MHASLLFATLLSCLQSAGAQTSTTISTTEFNDYVDFAAIGYLYAQQKCTALTTKDSHGHIWHYAGSASTSDGTNTFATPLLRRDDLKEYYLFFPGSETPQDWLDNAQVIPVDYPPCQNQGCKVHKGFLDGWNRSRQATLTLLRERAVQNITTRSYKLFIGGGSLGGAIGALAYADLKSNPQPGLNPTRGGSFGEPRLGNFIFAKWFNGLTGATPQSVGVWQRLTHGYDAVVRAPFVPRPFPGTSTPPDKYQHHGTEIWFQDSGFANRPQPSSTYVCLNNGENAESQKCANGPEIAQHPGNPGDHLTYPGYNTLRCGA